MLTHGNPSVAVCEEKSGQILRPNLAGYRAVGPHPAPCGQSWEVLTHYEATFELLRYVGYPLEPVRGLWGMGTPASGGTVNVKAHRRERGASVPVKRLSSVPIY